MILLLSSELAKRPQGASAIASIPKPPGIAELRPPYPPRLPSGIERYPGGLHATQPCSVPRRTADAAHWRVLAEKHEAAREAAEASKQRGWRRRWSRSRKHAGDYEPPEGDDDQRIWGDWRPHDSDLRRAWRAALEA